MLDRVALALDRPFDYYLPDHLRHIGPGWRVRVPFGPTEVTGLVVGCADEGYEGGALRPVTGTLDDEALLPADVVELVPYLRERWCCWWGQAVRAVVPAPVRLMSPPPLPSLYVAGERPRGPVRQRLWDFVEAVPGASEQAARAATGASAAVVTALIRSGALVRGVPPAEPVGRSTRVLNPDQQAAVAGIRQAQARRDHRACVLVEGVTGSGKTEVYLEAVAATLAEGRQAIVLVPEIALTPQMGDRFRERFPGRVAVFHSAMASGERVAEWYRVRRGEAEVVLGPRSAVFAPCPRLGLVIVDEEHEATYKQEDHPRYEARDVAERRVASTGGTLVLGSATPSLETAHRARMGQIGWVVLPERVEGRPLASVTVVDMRAELDAGNRQMFSRVLDAAVRETLMAGDQVVLLLNRRGFAQSVVCRSCGYTARCPACSVSLTWHREHEQLQCHYCDFHAPLPAQCPQCGSSRLRSFGVGTERILEEAQARWPEARIARADRDSLARRGSHARLFRAFQQHELDMLVGTQLLAKGMDWPGVTLVGIVMADLALSLPDFRAAERTYDLLTQAAGRAGRGAKRGRVVIQTYNPEHYSVRAAAAQTFQPFYEEEIAYRQELGYPPFGHLLLVEATGGTEAAARAAAVGACRMLEDDPRLVVRGPAPAPVARVRERYRCHVLVRAPALAAVLAAARRLADADPELSLTVDPYHFL